MCPLHDVNHSRGDKVLETIQNLFKVGDKAVYPAHGVGEVTSIEKKEIGGSLQTFYILKILDNGMKIMVPMLQAQQVGLREIISKEEADEVFDILREKEISVDTTTWNRRYREYMEKIKTGSVFEVAEVLRDLYLLKMEKDLSFGERKMLDTARNLLIKELSLAKKIDENAVEDEFRRIFQQ
jgi:CarD family transcriptional regulator